MHKELSACSVKPLGDSEPCYIWYVSRGHKVLRFSNGSDQNPSSCFRRHGLNILRSMPDYILGYAVCVLKEMFHLQA